MALRKPKIACLICFVLCLFFVSHNVRAEKMDWTVTLHPSDIVIGPDLTQLHTRYRWRVFNEQSGDFQVAIKKSAFPVPAPHCRMDYLILEIPFNYPESPQASPDERRKIYAALQSMHDSGKGSLTVHVDALYSARQTSAGPELTACNIYFVLPLAKDAAELRP